MARPSYMGECWIGEERSLVAEPGYTPLQSAARTGNAEAALDLLNEGADKNACNMFGETPLMIAAREGHLHVAEVLLDAGVDFTVRGSDFRDTALRLASGRGHPEIVRLLVSRGADKDEPNMFDETPLMIALDEGHFDVVDTLLAVDADVTFDDNEFFDSALHYAAMGGHDRRSRGHDRRASALLRRGADKDAQDWQGRTPLIIAAAQGHLLFVEAMLTAGANLSLKGYDFADSDVKTSCTALCTAAGGGHDEVVIALLRGGTYVNEGDETQETPLQKAARWGRLTVVETLLKAEADPNIRSVGGERKSALDHAASLGNVLMTKALLDGGAGANAHYGGRSALHFAALNDRPGAIAALVEAGAEIDLKTLTDEHAATEESAITVDMRSGSTPLLFAASAAGCKAMAALLEHEAKVNARDDDGHTPLHLVCAASRAEAEAAVAVLLRWAADATALS